MDGERFDCKTNYLNITNVRKYKIAICNTLLSCVRVDLCALELMLEDRRLGTS